jgi:hypothetical protein
VFTAVRYPRMDAQGWRDFDPVGYRFGPTNPPIRAGVVGAPGMATLPAVTVGDVVWSKNSICLNPIMVAAERTILGKAFQNDVTQRYTVHI